MYEGQKDEYTLLIHQDQFAQSPREDDNLGTMVCFHPQYGLGDEHAFANSDDFLLSLLADTLGDEDAADFFRDKVQNWLNLEAMGQGAYDRAVDAVLVEKIREQHIILPLYLYDHSGITMNTTGFSCPWDSGQVGWIYAAKKDIPEEIGDKNPATSKWEHAEAALKQEVDEYDHFLSGDCYGFELYRSGKEVDSCWGFVGGLEKVRAEMEKHLPDACRGITDNLIERDERASLRRLLKQAGERSAQIPHLDNSHHQPPAL